MSGEFLYHAYTDNIIYTLNTTGGNFALLILPIYIEEGTTLFDVCHSALTIHEIINHPAVMTAFEPRMIGTRCIVTGNILQVFATVESVTWQIKDRGFWSELFYKLTELSRVRQFTKERLEANACMYYTLDDTMIAGLTTAHNVIAGSASQYKFVFPQPIISIEIEKE